MVEILLVFSTNVFVGSTEAPSKVSLLFFLFSDWLKLNHLKSRIEGDFLDIFASDKLRNKFWREKMFRKPSLKLLR